MTQRLRASSRTIAQSAFLSLALLSNLQVLGSVQGAPASALATQTAAQSPYPLEPGKTLEYQISKNDVHDHVVSLKSGQFLDLVISHNGFYSSVTLHSPDGTMLRSFGGGIWYEHLIDFVAQVDGDYRLEVRAQDRGLYRIRASEISIAGLNERRRSEAVRLILEGSELVRSQDGSQQSRLPANVTFEQALGLFREARNARGEALALQTLGQNTAHGLREWQKGWDYLNQALALWRVLGEIRHQVNTLNSLASIAPFVRQPGKSTEFYEETIALARSLGDRRLEMYQLYQLPSRGGVVGKYLNLLVQARDVGSAVDEIMALNNIGAFYQELGEYQDAIGYYTQAIDICRRKGNGFLEANIGWNVGNCHAFLGEYRRAIDYFKSGVDLLTGGRTREPEARNLNSIGEIYEKLGEYEDAIECFRKAAEITTNSKTPMLHPYIVSRIGLARVNTLQGHRAEAISRLEEALASAPRMRPEMAPARCALYLRISQVFEQLGEHEKAYEVLRESLGSARAIEDSGVEADALYRMARIRRDGGHLVDARSHVEAAIEIIEGTRIRLRDPDARASYVSTLRDRYDLLSDVLMRLHSQEPKGGFDGLALANSERARARVLLDILAETRADIRQGLDPKLLEREANVRRSLSAKASQRREMFARKSPQTALTQIESEIRQLDSERQAVETEIRARNPRYAGLIRPRPMDVKAIQDQLLDSDTTLIEYQLGAERSFMWVLTKDSLASFELPKREIIDSASRRLYQLVTARGVHVKGETTHQRRARIEASDAQYSSAASELSRLLLGHAKQHLRKRLLIVADGALHYIPFAALPEPSGPQRRTVAPLVVSHEVVLLPSASALSAIRTETQGRGVAPRIVATLADPVFDKDDPRVTSRVTGGARTQPTINEGRDSGLGEPQTELERSLGDFDGAEDARSLSRLPFTRSEAHSIADLAPQGNSLAALDFKATKAMAMDPQLSQYRIVHFATHALLNTRRPALSGIVMSLVDENGEAIDGFLRLSDIYNLRLPADLVVLSACQTGLGKEINGEGMMGLTRGFMYAGAARIVASLWNVNDSVTAEFMKRFYGEVLARRKSPSAALREAQVQLWRQKQWQAPYYWSAFVIQGEYQ